LTEENIFKADPPTEIVAPVAQTQPQPDALPPELAELVGEGKKYKSIQEALKSIPHAQSHILTLEADLIKYKAEAEKARSMDELLEEFRRQGNDPAPAPQVQQSSSNTDVDIDGKVEAVLVRREAQRLAAENAASVVSAFRATFGDEGEARFIRLAQESGMAVAALNNLAMASPNVVLKLAGITKPTSTVPRSNATVNTDSGFNQAPQELSAKVKMVGATTKDVLAAWKIAGQKAQLLNKG